MTRDEQIRAYTHALTEAWWEVSTLKTISDAGLLPTDRQTFDVAIGRLARAVSLLNDAAKHLPYPPESSR